MITARNMGFILKVCLPTFFDAGLMGVAYSPLTRGLRLKDPALVPIAKEYHKTVAQILIRYTLQKVLVALLSDG